MKNADAVDQKPKKRRHGPMPRPGAELRKTRISVYLTSDEYSEVSRRAAGRNPAAYMRAAVLSRVPAQIPTVNIQVYRELARSAANLNQIAHSLNLLWQQDGMPALADIEDIKVELADFRIKLLGVKASMAAEDEEAA